MARGRRKDSGGYGAGAKFLRCPKGHQLPNRTNRGQCSPNYCAGAKPGRGKLDEVARVATQTAIKKALAGETDAQIDKLVPSDDPDMAAIRANARASKMDEIGRMGHSIGRLAARRAWLKIPEGLTGEAAEAHVRALMNDMSVEAAMDLVYDMRLGDDAQRRHARDRILDAAGHGKKESGSAGSAPIIILQGNAVINPPWKKPKEITVQASSAPQINATPAEPKDA